MFATSMDIWGYEYNITEYAYWNMQIEKFLNESLILHRSTMQFATYTATKGNWNVSSLLAQYL